MPSDRRTWRVTRGGGARPRRAGGGAAPWTGCDHTALSETPDARGHAACDSSDASRAGAARQEVGARGRAGPRRRLLAGAGLSETSRKSPSSAPAHAALPLPSPMSPAGWGLLRPRGDPLLQGRMASGALGTGSPTRTSYWARSSPDPVSFPHLATSAGTGRPAETPLLVCSLLANVTPATCPG